MAKKQLTLEEYKAKIEKKADKRKRFGNAFIKAFALFIACAIVFSASNIAFTRASLASGTATTNGTPNSEGTSVDEGEGVDWGDNNTTPGGDVQAPSDDNNTSSGDNQPSNGDQPANTPSGDNQSSGGQSSGGDQPSNNQGGNTAASILTSASAQFDYFVKSFTDVKKSAKSVTIVKKNGSNYNGIAEAGMFSGLLSTLMNSLLKEEEVGEVYTGADIAANFPPSGANSSLDKSAVKKISIKENGDYYEITITVKNETNPTPGKGVGAIASPLTKESIQDPIKDVPGLNKIEPICAYENVSCTAKIEKSTGHMVEYYYNMPLVLSFEGMSYKVGLAFEEWWTVAW